MPKPAYPVAGDVVGVPWATALSDFIGEKFKYVAVGWQAPLNGASPAALNEVYDLELPQIPANDPHIFAANVAARIYDNQGPNLALNVLHTGGVVAGLAYTSGVTANKGGQSGMILAKVGGVNLRSIKWKVTGTAGATGLATCKCVIQVGGYFVRENPTSDGGILDTDDGPWSLHPIPALEDEGLLNAEA